MEQHVKPATGLLIVTLLVAAVFAGPALQVLAASDWKMPQYASAPRETLSVLMSYPFGFFLVAITAYTFAIRPPLAVKDFRRALVAIICAVVVQLILLLLSFGLLFGIGESTNPVTGLTILATAYALIIGTVHRFILDSRIPWWIELPAHAAAGGLPLLILSYVAPGIDSAPRMQLFGAWPALLVLTPYALLVATYAPRAITLRSAALAVLLAAALPYTLKAVADWRLGRAMPLAWPYRVVTQFDETAQKQWAWGSYERTLRDGTPFRLGEDWYRLSSPNHLHQAFTDDMTPHTRLRRLHLSLPIETFQPLKKLSNAAPFVMLRVWLAAEYGPIATQPDALVIQHRDLLLMLDYGGNATIEPAQMDELRSELIAFVEGMRTSGPQN
jgi:putative flippase GtrA